MPVEPCRPQGSWDTGRWAVQQSRCALSGSSEAQSRASWAEWPPPTLPPTHHRSVNSCKLSPQIQLPHPITLRPQNSNTPELSFISFLKSHLSFQSNICYFCTITH